MALDERALFTERNETRPGRYQCPRCQRTAEYSIRWVRRSKKDRLPAGADERDRAKFAKLRDYLLRLDDDVTCSVVSERDFWGGRRAIIGRILRSFTANDAVEFFRQLDVPLRQEADGKLFPVSGRARDVLNALLRGADAAGVQLVAGRRVLDVARCE